MSHRARLLVVLLGSLAIYETAAGQQPSPTPTPTAAPAAPPAAAPAAPPDNERFIQRARAAIAGHENEPAGKVFKNVQLMKDVPASRLLDAMNGFSRALGASCTHCHAETDFASDDKRPKRAAREMMGMTRALNDQLHALKELRPLEAGEQRNVGCGLCHRGHVNPAEGMGGPRPPRAPAS
jgi:hypothetical protein